MIKLTDWQGRAEVGLLRRRTASASFLLVRLAAAYRVLGLVGLQGGLAVLGFCSLAVAPYSRSPACHWEFGKRNIPRPGLARPQRYQGTVKSKLHKR
jgi:hypothetical protein